MYGVPNTYKIQFLILALQTTCVDQKVTDKRSLII